MATQPGSWRNYRAVRVIKVKPRTSAEERGQRRSFKKATVKSCHTTAPATHRKEEEVTTAHETAVDLLHRKRITMD